MYFFRFIRIINLATIALTMVAIWFYCCASTSVNIVTSFYTNASLLTFSTLLIAAAGNIINDYYDVEADLINKPQKVVVGVYISTKKSVLIYSLFNGIALLIAIYLSRFYSSFWFFTIHFATIVLLWWYSFRLKKIFFIGNFLISILLATVPLLAYLLLACHSKNVLFFQLLTPFYLTCFFAFFAFVLNFTRELLKDILDIDGDKKIYSHSIAIRLGKKTSIRIVQGFLFFIIAVLISLFSYLFFFFDFSLRLWFYFLPLLIVTALLLYSFLIVKKNLKRSDNYIKLSFLFGLLLPFWWWMIGLT